MAWPTNKLFKTILMLIIILVITVIVIMVYLNITYPLIYKNLISLYSQQYGVDPYLVAAIINVESHYDKDAISHKEARGLMQISPITAYWAAESLPIEDFELELLFQPETNIKIGTWYLDNLSKEFNNNLQLILAAYNGGSGNVAKWLENSEYSEDGVYLKKIPFKETEQYIEKVLNNMRIYKIIYKGELNKIDGKDKNNFIVILHNLRKIIKSLVLYK